MFLGRLDAPAVPAQDKVRVYLAWGQSHIGGGFDRDEAESPAWEVDANFPMWWHPMNQTIPGCFIYDKNYRDTALTTAATDSARGGEACSFRPIQQGWIQALNYPWETPPVLRPRSWHTAFAAQIRMYHRGPIYIVPCGVGGSTLADRGTGAAYWDLAHYGAGDNSLLQVMMEGYWKPALQKLVTAVDGVRSNIEFGGVVSIIGTSEVFSPVARDDYGNKLGAIIDYVRGVISPTDDESCPWLIIKSPRAASVIAAGIDSVRSQCDTVASTRPGVTVADSINFPFGSDNLHFGVAGQDMIGATMARWAYTQTPLLDPKGDA